MDHSRGGHDRLLGAERPPARERKLQAPPPEAGAIRRAAEHRPIEGIRSGAPSLQVRQLSQSALDGLSSSGVDRIGQRGLKRRLRLRHLAPGQPSAPNCVIDLGKRPAGDLAPRLLEGGQCLGVRRQMPEGVGRAPRSIRLAHQPGQQQVLRPTGTHLRQRPRSLVGELVVAVSKGPHERPNMSLRPNDAQRVGRALPLRGFLGIERINELAVVRF